MKFATPWLSAKSNLTRNVRKLDELEGLCAFYALMLWAFRTFSNTLAETAKLVGIGGVPDPGELGLFAQFSVL